MTDKFGPPNGIDSRDYVPYMQEPGKFVTDPPMRILGHSLTSPSQNLTDAIVFTEVVLKNGRVVPVSRVKRAAQETSRTYTIGLPSAIWTPVMEQALRFGCTTTVFLIYWCSNDTIYDHWDILPEATINPPIEAEDVITTGEDANIITQTSELQTPMKLRGYGLGFRSVFDAGGTMAYRDVIFMTEDCPGCDGGFAQSMLAVGGDGTAVPLLTLTDNRWGSTTTLVSGQAATAYGQAVYSEGDFIIASFFITATTGAVRVSYNRGATWAVVTGIGVPINDIIMVNGTLVFVGGDAVGGAKVWISRDRGQSVIAITSAVLPASSALNEAAYDHVTGKIYICGNAGILLTARLSGSSMTFGNISANLPGSPGNLNAVVVRGKDEVVVGGAAGYLAQTRNGGATFAALAFPSTSAITAMDGNQWRLVIGAATVLYEQTALTKYEVKAITLLEGQVVTGDYTQVRMALDDDFNRFVAVTDDGEVVMGVPYYPGA